MAMALRTFHRRLQFLISHKALQRWFASTSNNQAFKDNKNNPLASIKEGEAVEKDSEFDDIFSKPVRNTEREYYETHLNPDWEGHKKSLWESRFFSKKHGVSSDLMSWLHWEINVNDNRLLHALMKRKEFEGLKEDQRYLQKRTDAVGYELGAAHFLVTRGSAVKFGNRETWFKKLDGQYSLPRYKIDNLYIEAVDASDTNLTYVSLDTLGHLSQIRYLRLHNCPYIDDACLARLSRLRNSLEFLDIENCPNITDCGLTSLQCLHKLQGLRLSKLENVKHIGLIALLLEEKQEGLKILGLTEENMKPPKHSHRGETRLVRALLGLTDGEDMEEQSEIKEFGNIQNIDLKRFIREVH